MSWEPIGLWGCSRSGYLDLWNNMRTVSYVKQHSPAGINLGSASFVDVSSIVATSGGSSVVGLPSLTTFTNPVDDKAWWWDISRPESGSFLGMQVISVKGLESNVIQQDSDILLDNNGTFSYHKPINKGFTMTVEAILWGLTCCSTAYGLARLRKALSGCCSDGCRGTRLRMISCIPNVAPPSRGWVPPVETGSPWRSLFNVRQIEQLSIISGSGISCGTCGCAPVTRVTFTLQAQGEKYLDPAPLLYQQGLAGSGCTLGCSPTCTPDPNLIRDPNIIANPLPSAPNAVISATPAIVSQQWQLIDFGNTGFDSELEVEISSGAKPLYGITVKAWPYNGTIATSSGFYNDCNVCTGFGVPYIAANVIWRRQVCSGLTVSRPPYIQDARGTLLDITWRTPNPTMRFGSGKYYISIEADSSVDSAAYITLTGRTVEP